MFVLGFFSVSYDYCIYVVCVNTGTVMSKGKMPAVKEKAYISHLQNHHEKKPVSKVLNYPFFQLHVKPCGSPAF